MNAGLGSRIILVIVIAALAWTIDSLYTQHRFTTLSPKDRLQYLWIQDFHALESAKIVPPGWYHLKDIVYEGGDPIAKSWISNGLRSPHRVSDQGTYRLEVLILSFDEESQLGAIIQYNLVNLKTSNMEWERGRTFILNGAPSEWREFLSQLRTKLDALLSPAPKGARTKTESK